MPSVPWTVYRIRNNANGKIYIGITAADLVRRFKEHLRSARRQKMLQHFVAKDPASHGSVLRQQKERHGRTYVYWTARVRYHGETHPVFCKTESDAERERKRLSLELYGTDHRRAS
jgi:hypothetical protein